MTNKKSDLEKTVEKEKPRFDADFSPYNIHNREAAKAHNLRYDRRRQAYVDSGGCLIRDKYGQRL